MGTVTIGGEDFTVYGTKILADKYWTGRRLGPLFAAWNAANTDDRCGAMVMAYDLLERQSWIDEVNTFELRDAITAFQEASYQLAAGMLADSGLYTAETSGKNIKKVEGAIGVSVEFFAPTLGITGRFPVNVQELIGDYLAGSELSSVSGSYASGADTDVTSTFDSGQFDITKGV